MYAFPRTNPVAPTGIGFSCGRMLAWGLVFWGSGLVGGPAQAQSGEGDAGEGLRLKLSAQLEENISPAQRRDAPVFLLGERISGRPDLDTLVEGNAELRKADTVIRSDRLEYDAPTDQARATGNVRVQRNGNLYKGPLLEIKPDSGEGFFENPTYQFRQFGAHGEASRAVFLDDTHTVVHNASYTTCRRTPGPSWLPDWILQASTITLDNQEDVGVAEGAYLSFKGVPILPVPAISFPLSEKRKSGFMPATIEASSISGTELVVPYYWNIAPNRDATITPSLMTARGVDLGAEFRYLEPSYTGSLRLNTMPGDKLRDLDRWGLSWLHNGFVNTGVPEIGNVAVAVNLNRVSDDNYWRDFTRSSANLTQRLLPGHMLAQWARGNLSATAQVHRWQTLQDIDAPIVPPYDRAPQLTVRYGEFDRGGFDWSLETDYTQFEADRLRTLQPNARRAYAQAQVSRPWIAPMGFFTPKLQLHASSYDFDAMLSNGGRSADSVVPTFSLDAGLVFERDLHWWGRDFVQTLEPRAFYVNTPYRDQSWLPNYDTGANDFNFATIFTENAFVGHDKISDNNLLTLGVSTRFLDPQSGAQLARFGLAQRLRFEDQRVSLNNTIGPAKAGISDILLGASVNLDDRWALDSTLQYNSETEQSVRSTVGARYNPGPYQVVNLAHRFQRNVSEQVDLSWQWPLSKLWGNQDPGQTYAVGRMNYSLNEGRLVDTLMGLEYDAGCWLGRVVVSRNQTSVTTAVQRIMFQLEFVGFTRLGIGSDPRSVLTQSISRYQNLRPASGASSRFENYD